LQNFLFSSPRQFKNYSNVVIFNEKLLEENSYMEKLLAKKSGSAVFFKILIILNVLKLLIKYVLNPNKGSHEPFKETYNMITTNKRVTKKKEKSVYLKM